MCALSSFGIVDAAHPYEIAHQEQERQESEMKKSPQCYRARLAGCPYLHNENAYQERERSEDESRTSP